MHAASPFLFFPGTPLIFGKRVFFFFPFTMSAEHFFFFPFPLLKLFLFYFCILREIAIFSSFFFESARLFPVTVEREALLPLPWYVYSSLSGVFLPFLFPLGMSLPFSFLFFSKIVLQPFLQDPQYSPTPYMESFIFLFPPFL